MNVHIYFIERTSIRRFQFQLLSQSYEFHRHVHVNVNKLENYNIINNYQTIKLPTLITNKDSCYIKLLKHLQLNQ